MLSSFWMRLVFGVFLFSAISPQHKYTESTTVHPSSSSSIKFPDSQAEYDQGVKTSPIGQSKLSNDWIESVIVINNSLVLTKQSVTSQVLELARDAEENNSEISNFQKSETESRQGGAPVFVLKFDTNGQNISSDDFKRKFIQGLESMLRSAILKHQRSRRDVDESRPPNITIQLESINTEGNNTGQVLFVVKRDGVLLPSEEAGQLLGQLSADELNRYLGIRVLEPITVASTSINFESPVQTTSVGPPTNVIIPQTSQPVLEGFPPSEVQRLSVTSSTVTPQLKSTPSRIINTPRTADSSNVHDQLLSSRDTVIISKQLKTQVISPTSVLSLGPSSSGDDGLGKIHPVSVNSTDKIVRLSRVKREEGTIRNHVETSSDVLGLVLDHTLTLAEQNWDKSVDGVNTGSIMLHHTKSAVSLSVVAPFTSSGPTSSASASVKLEPTSSGSPSVNFGPTSLDSASSIQRLSSSYPRYMMPVFSADVVYISPSSKSIVKSSPIITPSQTPPTSTSIINSAMTPPPYMSIIKSSQITSSDMNPQVSILTSSPIINSATTPPTSLSIITSSPITTLITNWITPTSVAFTAHNLDVLTIREDISISSSFLPPRIQDNQDSVASSLPLESFSAKPGIDSISTSAISENSHLVSRIAGSLTSSYLDISTEITSQNSDISSDLIFMNHSRFLDNSEHSYTSNSPPSETDFSLTSSVNSEASLSLNIVDGSQRFSERDLSVTSGVDTVTSYTLNILDESQSFSGADFTMTSSINTEGTWNLLDGSQSLSKKDLSVKSGEKSEASLSWNILDGSESLSVTSSVTTETTLAYNTLESAAQSLSELWTSPTLAGGGSEVSAAQSMSAIRTSPTLAGGGSEVSSDPREGSSPSPTFLQSSDKKDSLNYQESSSSYSAVLTSILPKPSADSTDPPSILPEPAADSIDPPSIMPTTSSDSTVLPSPILPTTLADSTYLPSILPKLSDDSTLPPSIMPKPSSDSTDPLSIRPTPSSSPQAIKQTPDLNIVQYSTIPTSDDLSSKTSQSRTSDGNSPHFSEYHSTIQESVNSDGRHLQSMLIDPSMIPSVIPTNTISSSSVPSLDASVSPVSELKPYLMTVTIDVGDQDVNNPSVKKALETRLADLFIQALENSQAKRRRRRRNVEQPTPNVKIISVTPIDSANTEVQFLVDLGQGPLPAGEAAGLLGSLSPGEIERILGDEFKLKSGIMAAFPVSSTGTLSLRTTVVPVTASQDLSSPEPTVPPDFLLGASATLDPRLAVPEESPATPASSAVSASLDLPKESSASLVPPSVVTEQSFASTAPSEASAASASLELPSGVPEESSDIPIQGSSPTSSNSVVSESNSAMTLGLSSTLTIQGFNPTSIGSALTLTLNSDIAPSPSTSIKELASSASASIGSYSKESESLSWTDASSWDNSPVLSTLDYKNMLDTVSNSDHKSSELRDPKSRMDIQSSLYVSSLSKSFSINTLQTSSTLPESYSMDVKFYHDLSSVTGTLSKSGVSNLPKGFSPTSMTGFSPSFNSWSNSDLASINSNSQHFDSLSISEEKSGSLGLMENWSASTYRSVDMTFSVDTETRSESRWMSAYTDESLKTMDRNSGTLDSSSGLAELESMTVSSSVYSQIDFSTQEQSSLESMVVSQSLESEKMVMLTVSGTLNIEPTSTLGRTDIVASNPASSTTRAQSWGFSSEDYSMDSLMLTSQGTKESVLYQEELSMDSSIMASSKMNTTIMHPEDLLMLSSIVTSSKMNATDLYPEELSIESSIIASIGTNASVLYPEEFSIESPIVSPIGTKEISMDSNVMASLWTDVSVLYSEHSSSKIKATAIIHTKDLSVLSSIPVSSETDASVMYQADSSMLSSIIPSPRTNASVVFPEDSSMLASSVIKDSDELFMDSSVLSSLGIKASYLYPQDSPILSSPQSKATVLPQEDSSIMISSWSNNASVLFSSMESSIIPYTETKATAIRQEDSPSPWMESTAISPGPPSPAEPRPKATESHTMDPSLLSPSQTTSSAPSSSVISSGDPDLSQFLLKLTFDPQGQDLADGNFIRKFIAALNAVFTEAVNRKNTETSSSRNRRRRKRQAGSNPDDLKVQVLKIDQESPGVASAEFTVSNAGNPLSTEEAVQLLSVLNKEEINGILEDSGLGVKILGEIEPASSSLARRATDDIYLSTTSDTASRLYPGLQGSNHRIQPTSALSEPTTNPGDGISDSVQQGFSNSVVPDTKTSDLNPQGFSNSVGPETRMSDLNIIESSVRSEILESIPSESSDFLKTILETKITETKTSDLNPIESTVSEIFESITSERSELLESVQVTKVSTWKASAEPGLQTSTESFGQIPSLIPDSPDLSETSSIDSMWMMTTTSDVESSTENLSLFPTDLINFSNVKSQSDRFTTLESPLSSDISLDLPVATTIDLDISSTTATSFDSSLAISLSIDPAASSLDSSLAAALSLDSPATSLESATVTAMSSESTISAAALQTDTAQSLESQSTMDVNSPITATLISESFKSLSLLSPSATSKDSESLESPKSFESQAPERLPISVDSSLTIPSSLESLVDLPVNIVSSIATLSSSDHQMEMSDSLSSNVGSLMTMPSNVESLKTMPINIESLMTINTDISTDTSINMESSMNTFQGFKPSSELITSFTSHGVQIPMETELSSSMESGITNTNPPTITSSSSLVNLKSSNNPAHLFTELNPSMTYDPYTVSSSADTTGITLVTLPTTVTYTPTIATPTLATPVTNTPSTNIRTIATPPEATPTITTPTTAPPTVDLSDYLLRLVFDPKGHDIQSEAFKDKLKQGLVAAYLEALKRNQTPTTQRRRRRKREVTSPVETAPDVKVELTRVAASNGEAESLFSLSVDGKLIPADQVESTTSTLSADQLSNITDIKVLDRIKRFTSLVNSPGEVNEGSASMLDSTQASGVPVFSEAFNPSFVPQIPSTEIAATRSQGPESVATSVESPGSERLEYSFEASSQVMGDGSNFISVPVESPESERLESSGVTMSFTVTLSPVTNDVSNFISTPTNPGSSSEGSSMSPTSVEEESTNRLFITPDSSKSDFGFLYSTLEESGTQQLWTSRDMSRSEPVETITTSFQDFTFPSEFTPAESTIIPSELFTINSEMTSIEHPNFGSSNPASPNSNLLSGMDTESDGVSSLVESSITDSESLLSYFGSGIYPTSIGSETMYSTRSLSPEIPDLSSIVGVSESTSDFLSSDSTSQSFIGITLSETPQYSMDIPASYSDNFTTDGPISQESFTVSIDASSSTIPSDSLLATSMEGTIVLASSSLETDTVESTFTSEFSIGFTSGWFIPTLSSQDESGSKTYQTELEPTGIASYTSNGSLDSYSDTLISTLAEFSSRFGLSDTDEPIFPSSAISGETATVDRTPIMFTSLDATTTISHSDSSNLSNLSNTFISLSDSYPQTGDSNFSDPASISLATPPVVISLTSTLQYSNTVTYLASPDLYSNAVTSPLFSLYNPYPSSQDQSLITPIFPSLPNFSISSSVAPPNSSITPPTSQTPPITTPPPADSLMVIKVSVKTERNISDGVFKTELEKGLREIYMEAAELNRRRKRDIHEELLFRYKRQADNSPQVQVASLERDPTKQSDVSAEFYVTLNGETVPASTAVPVFNRLNDAEKSAILGYSAVGPIKAVGATTSPSTTLSDNTSVLFIVSIVLPCVLVLVLIIVLIKCYVIDGWKRRSIIPVQRGETLDDNNLTIDMEKGEISEKGSIGEYSPGTNRKVPIGRGNNGKPGQRLTEAEVNTNQNSAPPGTRRNTLKDLAESRNQRANNRNTELSNLVMGLNRHDPEASTVIEHHENPERIEKDASSPVDRSPENSSPGHHNNRYGRYTGNARSNKVAPRTDRHEKDVTKQPSMEEEIERMLARKRERGTPPGYASHHQMSSLERAIVLGKEAEVYPRKDRSPRRASHKHISPSSSSKELENEPYRRSKMQPEKRKSKKKPKTAEFHPEPRDYYYMTMRQPERTTESGNHTDASDEFTILVPKSPQGRIVEGYSNQVFFNNDSESSPIVARHQQKQSSAPIVAKHHQQQYSAPIVAKQHQKQNSEPDHRQNKNITRPRTQRPGARRTQPEVPEFDPCLSPESSVDMDIETPVISPREESKDLNHGGYDSDLTFNPNGLPVHNFDTRQQEEEIKPAFDSSTFTRRHKSDLSSEETMVVDKQHPVSASPMKSRRSVDSLFNLGMKSTSVPSTIDTNTQTSDHELKEKEETAPRKPRILPIPVAVRKDMNTQTTRDVGAQVNNHPHHHPHFPQSPVDNKSLPNHHPPESPVISLSTRLASFSATTQTEIPRPTDLHTSPSINRTTTKSTATSPLPPSYQKQLEPPYPSSSTLSSGLMDPYYPGSSSGLIGQISDSSPHKVPTKSTATSPLSLNHHRMFDPHHPTFGQGLPTTLIKDPHSNATGDRVSTKTTATSPIHENHPHRMFDPYNPSFGQGLPKTSIKDPSSTRDKVPTKTTATSPIHQDHHPKIPEDSSSASNRDPTENQANKQASSPPKSPPSSSVPSNPIPDSVQRHQQQIAELRQEVQQLKDQKQIDDLFQEIKELKDQQKAKGEHSKDTKTKTDTEEDPSQRKDAHPKETKTRFREESLPERPKDLGLGPRRHLPEREEWRLRKPQDSPILSQDELRSFRDSTPKRQSINRTKIPKDDDIPLESLRISKRDFMGHQMTSDPDLMSPNSESFLNMQETSLTNPNRFNSKSARDERNGLLDPDLTALHEEELQMDEYGILYPLDSPESNQTMFDEYKHPYHSGEQSRNPAIENPQESPIGYRSDFGLTPQELPTNPQESQFGQRGDFGPTPQQLPINHRSSNINMIDAQGPFDRRHHPQSRTVPQPDNYLYNPPFYIMPNQVPSTDIPPPPPGINQRRPVTASDIHVLPVHPRSSSSYGPTNGNVREPRVRYNNFMLPNGSSPQYDSQYIGAPGYSSLPRTEIPNHPDMMSVQQPYDQNVHHIGMARYNPYEGLPPEPPAVKFHHVPHPNFLVQPQFPPLDPGIYRPDNLTNLPTFYQEPTPLRYLQDQTYPPQGPSNVQERHTEDGDEPQDDSHNRKHPPRKEHVRFDDEDDSYSEPSGTGSRSSHRENDQRQGRDRRQRSPDRAGGRRRKDEDQRRKKRRDNDDDDDRRRSYDDDDEDQSRRSDDDEDQRRRSVDDDEDQKRRRKDKDKRRRNDQRRRDDEDQRRRDDEDQRRRRDGDKDQRRRRDDEEEEEDDRRRRRKRDEDDEDDKRRPHRNKDDKKSKTSKYSPREDKINKEKSRKTSPKQKPQQDDSSRSSERRPRKKVASSESERSPPSSQMSSPRRQDEQKSSPRRRDEEEEDETEDSLTPRSKDTYSEDDFLSESESSPPSTSRGKQPKQKDDEDDEDDYSDDDFYDDEDESDTGSSLSKDVARLKPIKEDDEDDINNTQTDQGQGRLPPLELPSCDQSCDQIEMMKRKAKRPDDKQKHDKNHKPSSTIPQVHVDDERTRRKLPEVPKPDEPEVIYEIKKPQRKPQDLYTEIKAEMLKSYVDLNRKMAKSMPQKVENLTDDQLLALYEFHRKRLLYQRRQEASVKAKVIVSEAYLFEEIQRLKRQQFESKKKQLLDKAFPLTKLSDEEKKLYQ